ncbi:hypothetical protein RF11_07205 [Thelohanellus kitauei]|uniref:Tc1-like transposase DDE domain-containing protein n=1 Tax=Thelohanellus kitauei TaxID=669202 RepID=A0A0C2N3Y2_THEKT|nr:hypothetical protein RF11_07205 [Thelohanellus kitauei]
MLFTWHSSRHKIIDSMKYILVDTSWRPLNISCTTEYKFFIMDNVKFHKTNRVQIMLQENVRVVTYLPPYLPFFNPIEKFVLEMKEHYTNSVPEIRNRPV